jgi:hypothetical protein
VPGLYPFGLVARRIKTAQEIAFSAIRHRFYYFRSLRMHKNNSFISLLGSSAMRFIATGSSKVSKNPWVAPHKSKIYLGQLPQVRSKNK